MITARHSRIDTMNLNILVEKKQDGGSIASVLELPAYRVEAETRDLALAKLQRLLAEQLAAAEVVPLEIKLPHEVANNPWINYAGIFKDDPDFTEIAKRLRAERESDDDSEVNPALYSR
jgi:hypothetical protein